MKEITEIRYVKADDKEFWYSLDRHLPEQEFVGKVRDKRGYVLLEDNKPVGLLRYNLFWDNTPFCTMLFVDLDYHKKGYGRMLNERWEETGIWDSDALELKNKWEKEGILSDWDFLQAATDFLQMPIGEALISDNCLIRIFAILDRRAGKRTIKQIQDSEKYKTYSEWVRQFYKLRLES